MNLELHRAMWTFHHKHYAADLPAFANGLVWASIWTRWAIRSATSSNGRSAHAAPQAGGSPHYQGGYAPDGGYQEPPQQDGYRPDDGYRGHSPDDGYPQDGEYQAPPQQGGYPPRGGYPGSS